MGYVSYDSHADFEVANGIVSVYVKMSWYRSAELRVDTRLSDTTEILCISPDSRGSNAIAWMFIFDSIVNYDQFFKLEVVLEGEEQTSPKLLVD